MNKEIPQIVPQEYCLRCRVCCRYPQRDSPYAACFCADEIQPAIEAGIDERFFCLANRGLAQRIDLVYNQGSFSCPAFSLQENRCKIYPFRPLDCRLYPLMINYNQTGDCVVLSLDENCPFLQSQLSRERLNAYILEIKELLEDSQITEYLIRNFSFVAELPAQARQIYRLDKLTERFLLGLKKFSLNSWPLFQRYVQFNGNPLSSNSFTGIYIWSDIFNLLWDIIDGCLCIFAGGPSGYFLIIPPLGVKDIRKAALSAWEILNSINSGGSISRIENISSKLYPIFKGLGFELSKSTEEYICAREDICSLRGDRFKSHRASYNFFRKNYKWRILSFHEDYEPVVLSLYRRWMNSRCLKFKDAYFRCLAEDNLFALKRLLRDSPKLGLEGLIVEAEDRLAGFSLGCPLDEETFCVLFEITDLEFKGAAQFIFREFAGQLSDFRYLNLMDDSGLENLRKAKLSWRPQAISPVYSATL
jgi:hypothetical protein